MKWRADRVFQAAGLALLLASCGSDRADRPESIGKPKGSWVASDVPVKIGKPYQVAGRWWTPADERDYDAVGYATWYGSAHQGVATSSGERFDRGRITAAHRTLPLPSYVEVTALDTGRTILVRVNDRGPFKPERIIDLSEAAARQLGVHAAGISRVRVRRVQPPESERAMLRAGRPVGYRPTLSATERLQLQQRFGTMPAASAAPPPSGDSRYFIQVAALSDRDRADRLAATLGDLADADLQPAGGIWRVRLGPFADRASLSTALAQVRARGYQDATVAP